jgi:capsular polysaccharide biosynthesis protein
MRRQALDLRRTLQILRRRLTAIGIAAALGLLAGAGYAMLDLPIYESDTYVVLPASTNEATTQLQVTIATSNSVLAGALRDLGPAVSLQSLRSRIHATNLTTNLISIVAQGETAAQAEDAANAVAKSYIAYVGLERAPTSGQMSAQVVRYATSATQGSLLVRLIANSLIGTLLGALIGAVVVLAIGRLDLRLRERDQIADAIGVPVLASVSVRHPTDAGRWGRLLDEYEPSPSDAFGLRSVLNDLGQAGTMSTGAGAGSSITLLSLSSDPRALALGPQLAAFAASLGIRTALVIGPLQNTKAASALPAAATARPSSRRSSHLQVVLVEGDSMDQQPDAMLTVVVAVVDSRNVEVAAPMRTSAMILGVSPGVATAAQLARIAASAAATGGRVSGILIADPDPADPTTGRLPELGRPAQTKMPTRLTGVSL